MAKKNRYSTAYQGRWLPDATAKRKQVASIIEQAKKRKSTKVKKPKINLDRFAQWEQARVTTKTVRDSRKNLDKLLERFKTNPKFYWASVEKQFKKTQEYIESDQYKSKAKNLDTYDLVNAPHMNRNFNEAVKFQQIYESGDPAALPRYMKAAFRTLRDKMIPEEIDARLDYYQTTNNQILEVMKNVKGFEGESDERKLSEFYRIFNDAKSKMSMEYDSRDVMQAMLSGEMYEFIDDENEVNPQAMKDFIMLSRGDIASVSADIKKAADEHVRYPGAKRTSDRIKYLRNPETKLSEIENLTPEEFKMMTGINRFSMGNLGKVWSLFNNVGELQFAKEVIETGTLMLSRKSKNMTPYSAESYELVKLLREKYPDMSVVKLQKEWRGAFERMRWYEKNQDVPFTKGDDKL